MCDGECVCNSINVYGNLTSRVLLSRTEGKINVRQGERECMCVCVCVCVCVCADEEN